MNATSIATQRRLVWAELLSRPAAPAVAADPNRPVLASLLAGRLCGAGVLPATLGLPESLYFASTSNSAASM